MPPPACRSHLPGRYLGLERVNRACPTYLNHVGSWPRSGHGRATGSGSGGQPRSPPSAQGPERIPFLRRRTLPACQPFAVADAAP